MKMSLGNEVGFAAASTALDWYRPMDTARRCGLVLDSRTLRRKEVEASCPFCGDHGLSLIHI